MPKVGVAFPGVEPADLQLVRTRVQTLCSGPESESIQMNTPIKYARAKVILNEKDGGSISGRTKKKIDRFKVSKVQLKISVF